MLLKFYESNNSQKSIDEVVAILNDGGVIVYPTDTRYAIGCHALKERAIERICRIKGIDPDKHRFTVICSDMTHISEYARLENATFKLMKRNLPGPFAFILPAGNRLPKIFKNRKEVGIRIPDSSIIHEICRALDAPILSTSIPYDEEEEEIEYLTNPELIEEKLAQDVDVVIDGGIGGVEHCTVVSCIDDEPEIIRQGMGQLIE